MYFYSIYYESVKTSYTFQSGSIIIVMEKQDSDDTITFTN